MDRDQWKVVLEAVKRAAREVNRSHRPRRRPRFADWLIVAMFLWAVAHDRPQSWACDRKNYGGVFRPRKLPSVSQFNRRMNEPRTRLILLGVHRTLAGPITATALSYLDGKPLTVGVASKDPEAARGHVMGGFARGYKLHGRMSEDRRIPLWCVTPLNVDERPTARLLVSQVDELSPRSLTLADQNYDTHELHKDLDARGGRLLVEPKGSPDGRRHEVTLRQMGPARRELLNVQRHRPGLLRLVHRQRVNAEGILGNLCGYGGGLTGLPPWVRRLYRVRRWIGGKIILYHARLRVRTHGNKAA
jgi:Transposase DDE domain